MLKECRYGCVSNVGEVVLFDFIPHAKEKSAARFQHSKHLVGAARGIRQMVHKSSNTAALIIVMLVLMLFAIGLGMFIGAFIHETRHA